MTDFNLNIHTLLTVRSKIKDLNIIIHHNAITFRKRVMHCNLLKIFTSFFAKVERNDDVKGPIDLDLVVVNLD